MKLQDLPIKTRQKPIHLPLSEEDLPDDDSLKDEDLQDFEDLEEDVEDAIEGLLEACTLLKELEVTLAGILDPANGQTLSTFWTTHLLDSLGDIHSFIAAYDDFDLASALEESDQT